MNKTLKIVILGLLSIIGFLVFGYLNKLIFSDNLGLTVKIIYFIVSFMLALGIWGITAYLIANKWIMLAISLFSTISLLLFIKLTPYYIITLLLLFLITLWVASKIQKEKKARIKIILDACISPALKSIIAILCLITTLNYYYSPLSRQTKIDIPEKYQEKIISYVIPGFNLDMTVDNFIYTLMAVSENTPKSQIKDYIARKKSEINVDQFTNYKNQVLEKIGFSDSQQNGDKTVKEAKIMEKIFDGQLSEYLKKYLGILQFISTLSFYFIITWFWKLAYPLIFLVSWLFFKISQKIGFVSITKEKVEAEKVDL